MVLPVPGGPVQQHRRRRAALDEPPQRRTGPQQVPLPDHLVERARTHPHGQRGRRGRAAAGMATDGASSRSNSPSGSMPPACPTRRSASPGRWAGTPGARSPNSVPARRLGTQLGPAAARAGRAPHPAAEHSREDREPAGTTTMATATGTRPGSHISGIRFHFPGRRCDPRRVAAPGASLAPVESRVSPDRPGAHHDHPCPPRRQDVRGSAIRDLLTLTARPEVISLAGGLPAADSSPRADRRSGRAVAHRPGGRPVLRDGRHRRPARGGRRPRVRAAPRWSTRATSSSPAGPSRPSTSRRGPCSTLATPSSSRTRRTSAHCRCSRPRAPTCTASPSTRAACASTPWPTRSPRACGPGSCTRCRASTTRAASRSRRSAAGALAALADRYGFLVVEDDPYGLLAFDGAPARPVAAHGERVIRLGSASKILAPALRVGWLTGPAPAVTAVERLRQCADLCGSSLAHPRDRRRTAGRRRLAGRAPATGSGPTVAAPARAFTAAVDRPLGLRSPARGHVWDVLLAGVPRRTDTDELLQRALAAGSALVPGAAFTVHADQTRAARCCFASVDEATLTEAVARLAACVS